MDLQVRQEILDNQDLLVFRVSLGHQEFQVLRVLPDQWVQMEILVQRGHWDKQVLQEHRAAQAILVILVLPGLQGNRVPLDRRERVE